MNYNEDLLNFIDQSPSAFHAVVQTEEKLMAEGFQKITEDKEWTLKSNSSYYVVRDNNSIIAFKTPKQKLEKSMMIGAHTDSPCLRLKPNAVYDKNDYAMMAIEVYGGALWNSWFDQDLSLAGLIVLHDKKTNSFTPKIVHVEKGFRIPRLAIHIDRGVNQEGFKINPQTQLAPVIGLDTTVKLEEILAHEIDIDEELYSFELYLSPQQPSSFGGLDDEFIYAPRLDNLAMVHAGIMSLIETSHTNNSLLVSANFHNEEVGSDSFSGAGSNFLSSVIERVFQSLDQSRDEFLRAMTKSLFISADMAHAVHPNYAGKHDPLHHPKINQGPVIKHNANMRYATNAFTTALFKKFCVEAEVPCQDFSSNNELGCGSTIGPMTSKSLGIPTIDVGSPMLSMHSIREMAGSKDHELMINVIKKGFETF